MSVSAEVPITDAPTLLFSAPGPMTQAIVLGFKTGGSASQVTLGGPTVADGEGLVVLSSAGLLTPVYICEDQLWAVCPAGKAATLWVTSWIAFP
jgi:hypothetical protein